MRVCSEGGMVAVADKEHLVGAANIYAREADRQPLDPGSYAQTGNGASFWILDDSPFRNVSDYNSHRTRSSAWLRLPPLSKLLT